MPQSFFGTPRENSIVKFSIVSKFFEFWANAIIQILIAQERRSGRRKQGVAYIDLFSGPGKYKDGTPSTPVLVLEKALRNQEICDRIRITFNDSDSDHVQSLQEVVNSFEGIDSFNFRPNVTNEVVHRQLSDLLRSLPDVPTLLFVDGWGYKELSIEMIDSVLQKWGSDCIFFFNFNRINAAVENPHVVKSVNALFGQDRADRLRHELASNNSEDRELIIMEELSTALKESSTDGSPRYVLPFRFKRSTGSRTSHHLIHVSRHFLGYDNMKEIMAKESSNHGQEVATFEYNEATHRQTLLFGLNRKLEELEGMLLTDFAGQSATISKIHECHSVDTPFILKNYRHVLWDLWNRGVITAKPAPRRRNTFASKIIATFPPLA